MASDIVAGDLHELLDSSPSVVMLGLEQRRSIREKKSNSLLLKESVSENGDPT